MNELLIGGFIMLGLFIYISIALFFPEKF
ncbi:MAG TPA: potassium ABC transporter ATPase [Lentisphaeria bacterium]|nr:potassium ABC transporter ATPase [Lentisphaeria bacterium]